jgi:hypothetical protein
MEIDPEYYVVTKACPGEIVWDDLTRQNARILRVEFDEWGNVGYWLECDEAEMKRTGGGRFPWEISPPAEDTNEACLPEKGQKI